MDGSVGAGKKLRDSNPASLGRGLPRFMTLLAVTILQGQADATVSMSELAASTLDMLHKSGPWNLLQLDRHLNPHTGLMLAQTFSQDQHKNQESSWMTIIDLVTSVDLQLGPYVDLQKKFNKETELFFSTLESQESELSKPESAQELRSLIKKYEGAVKDIAVELEKQSALRKKNQENAEKSLQIKTGSTETSGKKP